MDEHTYLRGLTLADAIAKIQETMDYLDDRADVDADGDANREMSLASGLSEALTVLYALKPELRSMMRLTAVVTADADTSRTPAYLRVRLGEKIANVNRLADLGEL